MFALSKNMENGEEEMLSYKGRITAELISDVLLSIEEKFKSVGARPILKRKILSILVETLQNVFHHGLKTPKQPSDDDSTVKVYQAEGHFIVLTSNRLRTTTATELANRIESINSMSKDQLNESYRQILLNKQKSSATGSGVGIIDIVRRSGHKIDYTITPLDSDFSQFSMKVKISN